MTRRKEKILVIERGSTGSHFVENSLWKRLWSSLKTYYVLVITSQNEASESKMKMSEAGE
jgi:hypothetical protein